MAIVVLARILLAKNTMKLTLKKDENMLKNTMKLTLKKDENIGKMQ